MELSKAAETLKELGHPTRLSVYRELVKAGHEGLPVGELQKRLEIPVDISFFGTPGTSGQNAFLPRSI